MKSNTRISIVLLLLLTLVVLNQRRANAEDWQFMFDNNLQKVSYDKSSLSKTSDDVVKVWVMYDYRGAYWVSLSEIHFHFEINCRDKKMRTLSSMRYGKDNKRFEDGGATEWQSPRKDGPTENIFLFFCKNAGNK